MTISTFLELASFSRLRGAADDDSVDRLNHLYTVCLLLILTVLGTGTMMLGNAIDCMMPANFPSTYIHYVTSYCYVRNTYYIPMDESIPFSIQQRQDAELSYYQWVPCILLAMAFMFKLPSFIWALFNQASGLDLHKVNEMTDSLVAVKPADRTEGAGRIALYIHRWLRAQRYHQPTALGRLLHRLPKLLCVFGRKRGGSYLSALYLTVKMIYVLNVIFQFFLLTRFLGDWHLSYGLDVVRGLINYDGWQESPRFPKVTLCDFEIRQLHNIQRYTVQCTLNHNLFFDKIFFFLWFWLVAVAVITTGSFVFWLWRFFSKQNHTAYIKKYLTIQDKLKEEEDKKQLKKFVDEYLREDGVFLLQMMARNANIILMSEILAQLFEDFKKKAAEEENTSVKEQVDNPKPSES